MQWKHSGTRSCDVLGEASPCFLLEITTDVQHASTVSIFPRVMHLIAAMLSNHPECPCQFCPVVLALESSTSGPSEGHHDCSFFLPLRLGVIPCWRHRSRVRLSANVVRRSRSKCASRHTKLDQENQAYLQMRSDASHSLSAWVKKPGCQLHS